MGDEGEGSRQSPSPRLSPRAAPPAAPGSASRYTTAGWGRSGGARGAPAPAQGGAPLDLLTGGAARLPPSSAPASGSATAPAPARAAFPGRRQCLSDVLAAAAAAMPPGSCSLWLRGLETRRSSLTPRAPLPPSGRSGDAAGLKKSSWGDGLASDFPWDLVAGLLDDGRRPFRGRGSRWG